jgi:hypothetical protein
MTDAMKIFDPQEIVSSMQEVFPVGGEFLRLDASELDDNPAGGKLTDK